MVEPVETETLCVLCPRTRQARRVRDGGVSCWGCHERLDERLRDIAVRFAMVTATPSANGGGGRRAPGFGSRPPVNLHNAALRDPRTAPTRVGELHSPVNLVVSWAGWIRTARRQDQVRHAVGADVAVVEAECRYLLAGLDWITRQAWCTRFAEQVDAVFAQLRSATGERRPRPVGHCSHLVQREGWEPCAHPLFPPRPGQVDVVCGACTTRYVPLDQVRLVAATAA